MARSCLLTMLLLLLGSHARAQNEVIDQLPELNGQLLFHRYTSYESWNSKLYLYDFAAKSLTCLSDAWPVDHAMNAHFSPDGKRIVFMAVPSGKHQGNAWDVYLWDVSSTKLPMNLTSDNGLRDEDPKFSPDGKTIVFKQDGVVKFMDLRGKNMRTLPGQQPGAEYSMPCFTADGKRVVVLQGARDRGDLYAIDPRARSRTTTSIAIAVTPGLFEYYPVTWDANRLLYVRWHSAENRHDQIYRYLWKEAAHLCRCRFANRPPIIPIPGRLTTAGSSSPARRRAAKAATTCTWATRAQPASFPSAWRVSTRAPKSSAPATDRGPPSESLWLTEPPVVERFSPFAEPHHPLPGRLVNGHVSALLC